MKKSFLTFAITALVLSFTSCKETTAAEAPEETAVEVIETPAETSVEAVEAPVEEVVDSAGTDATAVEDKLNTASVE